MYAYNYIDSPRVLLSLAEVYLESGFPQMAASTVLRSIKELDTIDAGGACLLADALLLEKSFSDALEQKETKRTSPCFPPHNF